MERKIKIFKSNNIEILVDAVNKFIKSVGGNSRVLSEQMSTCCNMHGGVTITILITYSDDEKSN